MNKHEFKIRVTRIGQAVMKASHVDSYNELEQVINNLATSAEFKNKIGAELIINENSAKLYISAFNWIELGSFMSMVMVECSTKKISCNFGKRMYTDFSTPVYKNVIELI